MTKLAILVGIFAMSSPAFAEPDKWDWYNDDLKKAVDGMATESYCGGPVQASYDVSSFKTDEEMKVATQCGVAVGGIGSYCYEKSNKSKATVLKAVQTVTCHFDGSIKKGDHHQTRFAKKGSHVDFFYGPDVSNVGDEMQAFLKKALDL